MALENGYVGRFLTGGVHGFEAREYGIRFQGGVGCCGPGVVFLGHDYDDETLTGRAEGIDGLAEAFAVAPGQFGVLGSGACGVEGLVDFFFGGLLALFDYVVVSDVDRDYFRRVRVQKLNLRIEELVKG